MKMERQIITGRVTKLGEHTKAHYVENENGEILVHGAPQLKVGDNVEVATNGILQLARTTQACWATDVKVINN